MAGVAFNPRVMGTGGGSSGGSSGTSFASGKGLAGGGEIIVSQATLDLLDGKALYEKLPPAKLKGKSAEVALFRVTGLVD